MEASKLVNKRHLVVIALPFWKLKCFKVGAGVDKVNLVNYCIIFLLITMTPHVIWKFDAHLFA